MSKIKGSNDDGNDDVNAPLVPRSKLNKILAYDTFSQHIYHTEQEKLLRSSKYVDTFFRKTTKFWVLPSNFVFVKGKIRNKIPEWRYDGKISENLENTGSYSNSLYFDTSTFDYYDKRILQVQDSMLFRFRWYSLNKCGNVGFMEQKIRKPGWRSEASIKQRFQLNPNNVYNFLNKGKSVVNIDLKFIDDMYKDSRKYGDNSITHQIRTTYRRTVFQEYNSAPVRISFDEDVQLTDVKHLTFDEALDPSKELPNYKIFHFPLGILEVKLAFNDFSEISTLQMPKWIYAMQNSGHIIQVDKFSKYCTGVAVMNLGAINRVPSWIAAVKTLMEIELAKKGNEWFGTDKEPKWKIEENLSIPLRCEPREFMACERTLLKWVRMCFLALFVGLGLLGFQYEPVTGIILIIFSLIILFRSYYMYHIRLTAMINKNFEDPFHDPWGPPLLVILFVLPTLTYLANLLGLWRIHF